VTVEYSPGEDRLAAGMRSPQADATLISLKGARIICARPDRQLPQSHKNQCFLNAASSLSTLPGTPWSAKSAAWGQVGVQSAVGGAEGFNSSTLPAQFLGQTLEKQGDRPCTCPVRNDPAVPDGERTACPPRKRSTPLVL
jgi:hypothetical protein